MAEGEVVENFFGVYLLFCTNPRYKGRTYIGYTVNPNRRLNQHNRGTKAGGAWRTSNKGPCLGQHAEGQTLVPTASHCTLDEVRIHQRFPRLEPPIHIPMAYGPVKSVKVKKLTDNESEETEDEEVEKTCTLCHAVVEKSDMLRCLSSTCPLAAHIICLAREMLKKDTPGMLLPLEGHCPSCHIPLLWGDLVRLKQGCYQQKKPESSNEDWVDFLSQDV